MRVRFGALPALWGRLARVLAAGALAGPWAGPVAGPAAGQTLDNPVFPDVSPLARDGLSSLPGLMAQQNWSEAVRTVQSVLDEHADRVLEHPGRPGIFISVRRRAHDLLLAEPELLERYRRVTEPAAANALAEGRHASVERSMQLTTSGYEATLRVAEAHLQAARFETARLALEPLERHPDHEGDRAAAAASLLHQINAFLGRASLSRRAEAWSPAAGVGAGDWGEIEWPAETRVRVQGPLSRAEALQITELTATPLREVTFGERGIVPVSRLAALDAVPPSWTFPLVVGETVYVNDGYRVTALDRYSLRPLWATELSSVLNVELQSLRLNEAASLSAAPGVVLGVTGIVADNGQRWGDPRLHALDRVTGEALWSVAPVELDERFAGAIFRGKPVIEGDTAVMLVRLAEPSRRAVSAYLVGLGVRDGSLRWTRPIASAGSVGFSRDIAAGDWPKLHEGVVYVTDRLGAVAAVEAGTGRTRWVRVDAAPPRRVGSRVPTWGVQRPLVVDGMLVVLSADRRRVLWIELETGERAASAGVPTLDDVPQCIVPIDDEFMAVVSYGSIGIMPADPALAESAQPGLTGVLDQGGITGRPFAIGSTLFAPIDSGLIVIDPGQPRDLRRVALEGSGNAVVLDSQLLLADEVSLRSYLVWELAERVLRDRLAAEPTNADPALTLAELAFRSGRSSQLLGPLDRALEICAAQGDAALTRRAHDTILTMLEIGGRAWLSEGAAPPASEIEFDGYELAESLLERLARVTQSPGEAAGALMIEGRLAEARAQAERAMAAYQQVLTDPAKAQSTWSSQSLTINAGREAQRRLREALVAFGADAYERFEREASRALDSGQPGESVAARYPVAKASASAWLGVSESAATDAERLAALERGSRLVLLRRGVGDPVETAIASELLGRAARAMVDAGRLSAARRLLDSAGESAVLTARGETLDPAALLAEVGERLGERGRLPDAGRRLVAEAQVLEGWRLALPLTGGVAEWSDQLVTLVSDAEPALGLFEASRADGVLVPRWQRPFESVPFVLRIDDDRVLVYQEGPGGKFIESFDASTGQSAWRAGPMNQLLEIPRDPRRRGAGVQTPLDGWRQPDDLVIDLDAQTLVVASRNGRWAGLSLDDGTVLWSGGANMDRVVDVSVADGRAAIAGDVLIGRRTSETRIVLADARTGDVIHRLGRSAARLRWAKLTDDGLLVLGADRGVIALRASTGMPAWDAAEPLLSQTLGGWLLGDRLMVLGPGGELLLAAANDGRFTQPLAMRPERRGRGPMRTWRDDGRIVVGAEQGLSVYDPSGRLIATDGLVSTAPLLVPAAGRGVALLTDRSVMRGARGSLGYRVRLMDTQTGKIVDAKRIDLPEPPAESLLLDGVAVISTPSVTIALPTAR